MKNFLLTLALAMATLTASAQFASPPVIKNFLNVTGVYTVVGSSTTNTVTSSTASTLIVGRDGLGIGWNAAGTNAATTNAITFRFDTSGDGVNWNLAALTAITPVSAAAYTIQFTNINSTSANVMNLALVRLASIQNTNAASIFITNLTLSTR